MPSDDVNVTWDVATGHLESVAIQLTLIRLPVALTNFCSELTHG